MQLMGVERRVKCKEDELYLKLTNVDLELLGVMQRKCW